MRTTEGVVRRSEVGFEATEIGEVPLQPDPGRDPDDPDGPRVRPAAALAAPRVQPAWTAIARALACIVGTWALLSALTTILTPAIGASWASVAAMALALVPVAAVALRIDGGWKWVELESTGVGLILGFFLLPSILFPAGGMPEVILAGYEPRVAPELRTLPPWIAAVVLAPILEELLYRKLLLQALARHVGSVASVIAVSLLVATCQVGPWSWLGAVATGVMFGILMLTGRSTALCIGMHAGFHGAALLTGIRPWQQPLPLVVLSPAGLVAAAAGVALIYRFALITSFRSRKDFQTTQAGFVSQ